VRLADFRLRTSEELENHGFSTDDYIEYAGRPPVNSHAMQPNPHVTALIPAYDEADRVGAVVESALRYVRSVLVVDDGSSDGTDEVARRAGAEVVRHAARQGKGVAIRTGIDHLRGRDHRYLLLLDADGQHDPDDAPPLILAAERQGYDLVIGHRVLDKEFHGPVRYYTNLVGCNVLSRWTGLELLDSQSGFRLVRAAMLDEIELDARGFEIETEMLLKLCRRGARVGHVEVRSVAPNRKSRLRPVRDVTRICMSALKYHYLSS
jgi:glycosyltransferase involved in cell wall biosynthesis